ncbi:hypothetical protein U9Y83_25265, partial [Escherichia coli]
MTWELILDGYSESSYSATPRFAAARLPWFSRCAHVIDARRCAGVAGSSATLTLLPLPRFAGVTNARCRLLG